MILQTETQNKLVELQTLQYWQLALYHDLSQSKDLAARHVRLTK